MKVKPFPRGLPVPNPISSDIVTTLWFDKYRAYVYEEFRILKRRLSQLEEDTDLDRAICESERNKRAVTQLQKAKRRKVK